MRVFECGTGHGALTLHLARALLAAAPSALWRLFGLRRGPRHALTTLDRSAQHSAHARRTVAAFRRGIYLEPVTFHVGEPAAFLAARPGVTYTHAVLDVPGADALLAPLAAHLEPGAPLLLFAPSVTQILDAVRVVRGAADAGGAVDDTPAPMATEAPDTPPAPMATEAPDRRLAPTAPTRLPLLLERVLELGPAVGVGGRAWDVVEVRARNAGRALLPVVRPAVGARLVGGGFVACFRRMAEPAGVAPHGR
jgi:tRNA (adenine57-N1/adenine58-N1)-methyltransferase